MDIEQAIYERLIADATLTGLAGSRGYADEAPEGETLPLWIYEEADSLPTYTLAGSIDLGMYLMRIECYGETRASAKAVRAAIRASLSGFAGTVGGDAIRVLGAFVERSDSGADLPVVADEFGIFRAGLDVRIHHRAEE